MDGNEIQYKNLSMLTWNLKCFVIPVIIGATGIVTKGPKKYLKTIPGKRSVYSVQKKNICTRGIAHNKESATI
jgi:hypothetical protein